MGLSGFSGSFTVAMLIRAQLRVSRQQLKAIFGDVLRGTALARAGLASRSLGFPRLSV